MKDTNYHNLQKLKRAWLKTEHEFGIIFGHEIKIIKEMLELESMDLIDLQNCRDMCVMLIRSLTDASAVNYRELLDLSSAISGVIDEMKYRLGGQVS